MHYVPSVSHWLLFVALYRTEILHPIANDESRACWWPSFIHFSRELLRISSPHHPQSRRTSRLLSHYITQVCPRAISILSCLKELSFQWTMEIYADRCSSFIIFVIFVIFVIFIIFIHELVQFPFLVLRQPRSLGLSRLIFR